MPATAAHRVAPPSAARRTRLPGLAVLVAEDNDINALLARHLLSRLGHRPVMAATGGEAVAAFVAAHAAGTPFDLVLMDLHMPGMDGIEAARRMRAAEPGGKRTPIVALTADAFPRKPRRLSRRRHGRLRHQAARPRAADGGAGAFRCRPRGVTVFRSRARTPPELVTNLCRPVIIGWNRVA